MKVAPYSLPHAADVTWMEPTNARRTLGLARSGCVTRLPKIAPTYWDVTSLNTLACQVVSTPWFRILFNIYVIRQATFLLLSPPSCLLCAFPPPPLLYLTYIVTAFIREVPCRTWANTPTMISREFTGFFLYFSGLMPGTSQYGMIASFQIL